MQQFWDSDLLILALALGVILYGIFKRSNVAGYEVTPPPQKLDTSADPVYLPGVSKDLMEACADAVDVQGGTLAGPVSEKGMEPERIDHILDAVVLPKIRAGNPSLELMRTTTIGGTCVVDSDGAEQYELVWMMYERTTNTAVQMVTGVLALESGRYVITRCAPYSKPPSNKPCGPGIGVLPGTEYASYELPISPDI